MPIAWKIAIGVLCGGMVGYLFSRLFYAQNSYSFGANRPAMAVFGAILGVVVMTLAFRGGVAASGEEIVTRKEFTSKVLASDKPVIVDFFATWCGPCKVLAPVLTELEEEYGDRIDFYRVDVDKAGQLARDYDVSGVPTLVFFVKGKEVPDLRIVGGPPKHVLAQYLDALTAE